MELTEYEKMQPHAQVDGMIFYTPNSHCAWRVSTLYSKEPDTIAWMNAMNPGETMFDVGANVGLYTVYAAKRGINVYAFEPESQNFAILTKNIMFNKLNNALAFPVALSDSTKIDTLRLSMMMAGGSCHTFGHDINYKGEEKKAELMQGCVAFSLDDFSNRYGFPNHIKIDVDGLEHEVIAGSKLTLPCVESLLVELDSRRKEHEELKQQMFKLGFKVNEEQVKESQRKEGPFEGIGNVIFYR